jgi:carbon monoxide dehydrogenase subunit G
MNHFHDEVRIEAPVEHAWAFLLDPSHLEEWQPRAKYSDVSGPLDQAGTTFVQTSRLMGFEMKGTLKVLEVEPLRLLHIRNDSGPTDMFFRFEPEGEGTRLTLEGDYDMQGPIPGFIKSIMTKSFIERQTHQMLEDIKALAEATVPVTA